MVARGGEGDDGDWKDREGEGCTGSALKCMGHGQEEEVGHIDLVAAMEEARLVVLDVIAKTDHIGLGAGLGWTESQNKKDRQKGGRREGKEP